MSAKNDVKLDIRSEFHGKGTSDAVRALDELGAGHRQAGEATRSHTSRAVEFIKGLAGYDVLKMAASRVFELAKQTMVLAARNETLGIVTQVVGRNIGATSLEMQRYVEGVRKMGITTLESQQSVIMMAQAQMDLTKASQLARVAQDAAVIGGINSSEAFGRLIYGIQSGQTEILRTIGINVNFERSYQQLAVQLKKTTEQLTEQEKAQARTGAVLEAGQRIMGAYEAAMGTAGKQLTSLARYTEDLKVVAGQTFNEALVIAVNTYTNALKDAGDEANALSRDGVLKQWGRDTISTFAFAGDAVVGAWDAISQAIESTGVVMLQSWNAVIQMAKYLPIPAAANWLLDDPAGKADRYVDAFVDRANERLASRLNRKRNQFRDSADEFFAAQDRDAAERSARNREDDRDLAVAKLLGWKPPKSGDGRGGARGPKDTGEQLVMSLEKELRSLQHEASKYNDIQAQITEGTKKYSEANKEKALDLAEEIDQQKRLNDESKSALHIQKMQEEREKALEEAATDHYNALKKEAQALRESLNPWAAAASAIERYDYLLAEGVISAELHAEAVAKANEKTQASFKAMTDAGTEGFNELKGAVEGWGRETSRSLAQAALDGRVSFQTLGQAARNFLEELLAIQIKKRMMDPWLQAGTRFLDNILNPAPISAGTAAATAMVSTGSGGFVSAMHSGWGPGDPAGARRYVHPAYFERAPRLHGGIGPHEMPAVIRRDESVLTPGQMRALGGRAPSVTVQVINQSSVPVQAEQTAPKFDGEGFVIGVVLRDMVRGGPIRDAVKRASGPVD